MNKLIVITGADGTGKSTLIMGLLTHFKNSKQISIWDAMGAGLFNSKHDIDKYLCTLSADARLLFLAHALKQALFKAQEGSAPIYFFNGYYYKYFVSEFALGANKELVKSLASLFPNPQLVLKLNLNEEIAFSRKDRHTSYECGLEEVSKENFVKFQQRIKSYWSFFEVESWSQVSSVDPPENILAEAIHIIESRE